METSTNTYYDNPRLGRLNEALIFVQRHFRILVILASFLLSFLFVYVKGTVLSTANISVTEHLGQVSDKEGVGGRLYYGDYTLQMNNLIAKGSFLDNGQVLNRYVPVYPLLLYAAYQLTEWAGWEVQTGVLLLTALLIALSALLICEIAFLFYRNRLLALLAGLVFASQPYVLQGLTKTMSATPFMTFFFLALLLFFGILLKPGKKQALSLLLLGMVLGLAILTRPIGLFMPFIFAFLYIVFSRRESWMRRSVEAAAIVLGALVTVAPWQAFNYAYGEKVLLSSDRVYSILDGIMFNNSPHKEPMDLPEDVEALTLRLSASGVESKGEFFGLVLEEFRTNPAPVIKLYGMKAARSWYGAFAQQPSKEFAKMAISLFYLLLTVLGILSMDLSRYESKVYVFTFILLTLYFWAMTILVVSMVRYMIPVFGFMSVFIPGILSRERLWFRKNASRPLAVNSGNYPS